MTDTTLHPSVRRYLDGLDKALRDLPKDRRSEIVRDIEEHIAAATAGSSNEADIRNALDQVGDPETIATDARERFGITKVRGGALEGIAIALLLIGGVVIPFIGWFVGAALLWVSKVWTLKEKVIGTLVVPGGLALAAYFALFATGASSSCDASDIPLNRPGTDPAGPSGLCVSETVGPEIWATILLAFLVIAPIASAVYLGRKAFRR